MAKDLVQLLRAIASSRQDNWRESFEARLKSQASKLRLGDEVTIIYQEVFREFEDPEDSRWYDPYHILFSTDFAMRLVRSLGESIPDLALIIPAVLLHDVGYYAVHDKTKWSGLESRVVHMQEGAARAARILWTSGGRLKPEEVEAIVGMVAVHDNPYIGIPVGPTPLRRAMRDCDRVWVVHALSFYKDWQHKRDGYVDHSKGIEDFLADRIVQFFESAVPGTLRHRIHEPLPKLVEQNRKRVEPPYLRLTRECVERLIERRGEEIDYISEQSLHSIAEALGAQPGYFADRIDGDFDLIERL